jgi:hypothetical protein
MEPALVRRSLKIGALRFAQGYVMDRPETSAKVLSRFPKL